MKWIKTDFKGTEVWAEVDEAGKPVVAGGRRAIRYKDTPGSKVYNASAAGVKDLGGEAKEIAAPSENGASGNAASGFGKAGTRTAAQTAAAATDARTRIDALPPGTILAFTDGACTDNPGPAGSGAVVRLASGRDVERSRALGEGTNNIAELTAIGMAMEILREEGVPRDAPIALFTDSSYAIGVLAKGWKAKANIGLIAELKRELVQWERLQLHWVAGHAGVKENERADELAGRGVEESKRR